MAYEVRLIEEMGLTPVVGANALKYHGHLAGTDEERLTDLNRFLVDDSISAVACVTGGFGALALLSGIDYDGLKKNPKLMVGSDENTALLLAVHKQCALPVVLAPNLDRVRSKTSFESLRCALTSSNPIRLECEKEQVSEHSFISQSYSSFTGKASGIMCGGNLSAVLSLMGTPYQPEFENVVLYLDDYNERYDILDRWFTTLYVAGALAQTNGVMFGDFNGCGARGNTSILPIEDVFGDRLNKLKKTNMFGLPSGHNSNSHSLPLGVRCQFDTKAGVVEFECGAVS
jgi:muramoyltetrapeptide carboxypeptidase